ncbi:hypothetical protein MMC34_003537 [Xylographa carneopallida]|nr:hypothetical protein [Xylographa carneopallida]
MACPKASTEHTKVVRFEHDPNLASPQILHPVATGNPAFDATKLLQQWTHAVDLYCEHDLKLSAKKHRQILRGLRLLVPPQMLETPLTPEIQKFIALLWYNLGQIQTLRSQEPVACEAFSLSVKNDGKSALAWFSLGNSYFKLGSFEKSVTAHAKCLDIFDEMDAKTIEFELEVSLENAARINSEMGGINSFLDASVNTEASNAAPEKQGLTSKIKKFVLSRAPNQLNLQLGDLHKAWKATKTNVSPGGDDKLNAVPSNVVYAPMQNKTIMGFLTYDPSFNPPIEGSTKENELDMYCRGYHDAMTKFTSSSKQYEVAALSEQYEFSSSSKQNDFVTSAKGQETALIGEEKLVHSSAKGKKKKKSSSKKKVKGKMLDAKWEEEKIDLKVEDQKIDTKEKLMMIDDEKAEDRKIEAKEVDNILTMNAVGQKDHRKGKAKLLNLKIDVKGEGQVADTKIDDKIAFGETESVLCSNKINVNGKGKISDKKADVGGTGNVLSVKVAGKKIGSKGKGKTVDAKIDLKGKKNMVNTENEDEKGELEGKGKQIDANWRDDKPGEYGNGRTSPYFSKVPAPKPRQPAEVEMVQFATARGEKPPAPLWLIKHRAIEEHFDDYHSLLPTRDIVLDDFYRHAKNAVINDIYWGSSKFDPNVPPLQWSLKGVDNYYRKAFKELPDLDGEDDWYCSISDMFFGKPQHASKLAEIEAIRVDDEQIPGNITTEEFQMEMRKFLGMNPPAFSDQPVPGLPIEVQLAIHNRERKEHTKAIKATLKAKEDAKEPPINYAVNILVDDSQLVYLANKVNDGPATASTHALTQSTAPSTHFGSTFTGTGTVLLTPATPGTGDVGGGPVISLTPADQPAVSRYSEPEFEIGLPGMRTSLPHQVAKKAYEEKHEVAYMPDGVTPLQKGTGDGKITPGMGPGEMLYPTVFEGF